MQQDVYLFSGTVAQNIAYGKPGATRQEIEAAARLAGAEKFILAPVSYTHLAAANCPRRKWKSALPQASLTSSARRSPARA